jgi:hypothetical protein
MPLLQLSNARWISAEIAKRERPLELATLGLWVGPSAEEQAHQQAIERREAERRRERERAEEHEREADRRRAEAQAREREAARRKQAAAEARRRAERDAPLHERRAREAAARAEAVRQQRSAREQSRDDTREPEPQPRSAPVESVPATASVRASERALLPEELLLEAVREELRLVRADNAGLVSNRLLETLVLGEPRRRGSLLRHEDGRLELDVAHPLFTAVLEGYLDDPGLLTLLASAAYSYLNLVHVEIEDTHEAEFIRRHAGYAATGLGSDPE